MNQLFGVRIGTSILGQFISQSDKVGMTHRHYEPVDRDAARNIYLITLNR